MDPSRVAGFTKVNISSSATAVRGGKCYKRDGGWHMQGKSNGDLAQPCGEAEFTRKASTNSDAFVTSSSKEPWSRYCIIRSI